MKKRIFMYSEYDKNEKYNKVVYIIYIFFLGYFLAVNSNDYNGILYFFGFIYIAVLFPFFMIQTVGYIIHFMNLFFLYIPFYYKYNVFIFSPNVKKNLKSILYNKLKKNEYYEINSKDSFFRKSWTIKK